ncbi:MAG: c-type cytochrome [Steroidobacteraceae bacterium]
MACATVLALAASQSHAEDRSTNLRVLSPKLSTGQVKRLMEQYKNELGVTCAYCHTQDRDTQKIDFASEQNPMKEKTRLMISMTEEINVKFLSQIGERRYAEPFSCAGCHQGKAKPQEPGS